MSLRIVSGFMAALLAGAPAFAASPTASAALIDGKGAAIGRATFTEAPTGVLIHIEASGLKPGWHGVHLHEKGDCMGPAFATAGAHMNMSAPKSPHGFLSMGGPDLGDLPNIYVGPDGKAMAEAFSHRVSLSGAGGRPALLDADGASLMIHENPDDYTTQPIGGAGARVACGVVKAG